MKQPWNPQMKENISVPPCVIGCWTLVLSRDVILWDVCVCLSLAMPATVHWP